VESYYDLDSIFYNNLQSYDNIVDLYYSWLYSRIHYLISTYIIDLYRPKKILDVGCGTGFQSYLHALGGSAVMGVDISKKMIHIAKRKIKNNGSLDTSKLVLFPEKFEFVKKYNNSINSIFRKIGSNKNTPNFIMADVYSLPFSDRTFDHINCCGSVLSLIDHHQPALKEISRVLKSGGTIFMEIESRWNLDLFWTIINSIIKNKLGFNCSLHESFKSILINPLDNIAIDYPYGDYQTPLNIRLKLYTDHKIKKDFYHLGWNVVRSLTIHSVTNLIPSVIMRREYPSKILIKIFKILCTLEESIPFQFGGCSKIFILKKF
jgi:ubiquinone/menaquinone biosynthesis C-methylase UbiE